MTARSAVRSMMMATLVSRSLGFAKALLLVTAIGGTSSTVGGQVFEVANKAPTLLFALIAGGILGAILVPQLVRDLRAGQAGQANMDRLLTLILAGGVVVTIVLTLCAPVIVRLYAAPWSEDWRALATALTYWCLPQVFFLIVFAVLSQVLNAREVFGPPAWTPAISNLIGIGGILVFLYVLPSGLGPVSSWTGTMVAVLAGSATVGIAVQALLLVLPLRKIGFRLRLRWGFGGLGHMSGLVGWTLLGVMAGQLAYLVTSNVASRAGATLNHLEVEGPSLNSLGMAYLLVLLPHGIVTVALTTALYARMSHAAAQGRLAEVASLSRLAARPVTYVSLAAAATFVVLGPLFAQTLWGTPVIGQVLQVLAIGLVGFSQAYVLNRTSFALQDARGPFWTQLVIAVVTVLSTLASAVFLPPALTVLGIAAGMSVANLAGWLTASLCLRGTLRRRGHRASARSGDSAALGRLLVTGAVTTAVGVYLLGVVKAPATFIGGVLLLAVAVAILGGLFVSLSWLLGDRTLGSLRR